MIDSRKLSDLHPDVQSRCVKFVALCRAHGIQIIITSTYRDKECQDSIYAQGRTKPGRIVTNARGGQSFHQYCVAFDVVPMQGKPVWDDEVLWHKIGELGKSCDLEWAGDWLTFREKPHFQYTAGLTIKDFQAGKTLPTKPI
ncbi:MAG: M15 family metallopeptidase [Chlorobiaceae bacterium]